MPTPRIERETTITFNEEEEHALVWSASPGFQARMKRHGVEPYQVGKRTDVDSHWYRVPKTWVKVSPPRHRELTEAQREELRERGKALGKRDRGEKHSNSLI